MKLQIQGKDECALAALAMLAEVPLDDVREYALLVAREHAGIKFKTWSAVTCAPSWSTWWHAFKQTITDLGLPANAFLKTDGVDASDSAAPDLQGRGYLRINWKGRSVGHGMAYENGMIYDPNGHVENWETWLAAAPTRYGLTVKSWEVHPIGEGR